MTLSPAQLQERRDAAEARWRKAREAGAALTGAAAGAAGAIAAVPIMHNARRRAVEERRIQIQPLRETAVQSRDRLLAIDARRDETVKGLRSGKKFLATAAHLLELKARAGERAATQLSRHVAEHTDTYLDTSSGEIHHATDDLEGENRLRLNAAMLDADNAAANRKLAIALRTKGRDKRVVERAGSILKPKVDTFDRSYKGKPELDLSGTARAHLEQTLADDEAARASGDLSNASVFHHLKIHSVDDLAARVHALHGIEREGFLQYIHFETGLPTLKLKRPKKESQVRNVARIIPPHKATLQGWPSDAKRKQIRAPLIRDVEAHHQFARRAEIGRAEKLLADLRGGLPSRSRLLSALTPRNRRLIVAGGLAAGALVGGAAAYGTETAIERKLAALHARRDPDGIERPGNIAFSQTKTLAKQADPTPALALNISTTPGRRENGGILSFFDDDRLFSAPPSPAASGSVLAKANQGKNDKNKGVSGKEPAADPDTVAHLLNGAENVEQSLGRGVARALASWKDAATPERIADPEAPGSLFDLLDQPLNEGMAPLDQATLAGLNAPTRIIPPNGPESDGGDGRLIQFGFNLRTPGTTEYAQRYRYARVREITNAQRQNIRQIITDATLRGDPPAVTARHIRDVVGLTAHQAQVVQNYRVALQTLDPRMMNFALRDKRYDPTLRRALEHKKPLSDADIDKMVDAYQRRFIAYRAMTIARTESLRAANNAHVDAVQTWLSNNPGFTIAKTWIATEDDRTRPDHRGLHHQTVIGMQTPFVCESGEKIRWPHDPRAAAKEVCNCRCTLMTVLIPRTAAMAYGPDMYGNPTQDFWSGPRTPFDINSPEDLFGEPA